MQEFEVSSATVALAAQALNVKGQRIAKTLSFHVDDHVVLIVAAGDANASNAMTVSWGGMGTIWNKPVVTIYIRPQRYTKQFVDGNDLFTLSFFDSQYKQALGVLGTKSGRDGDKIAEVGFTPVQLNGTTTYEQADLVFVCRKLYADAIKPECFVDASVDERNYPQRDHHTLYIAEVEHIYQHI